MLGCCGYAGGLVRAAHLGSIRFLGLLLLVEETHTDTRGNGDAEGQRAGGAKGGVQYSRAISACLLARCRRAEGGRGGEGGR